MAKEYRLTIDVNGLSGGRSRAQQKLDSVNGKGDDGNDKNKKLKGSVKALTTKAVLETVNNIAMPMVEYQINSYSARFGNSARANTVKNIQRSVGRVNELGDAVLTGASAGGWIGALVMGTLDMAKQAIEINQNLIDYQTKQDKYKFTEIRASERLGLTLSDRNRNNF